jgi:hypothetical protein
MELSIVNGTAPELPAIMEVLMDTVWNFTEVIAIRAK